jgi:hypothetical protein
LAAAKLARKQSPIREFPFGVETSQPKAHYRSILGSLNQSADSAI